MAQKRQLVRRGIRDLQLTVAVRSGAVIRARNGWYSTFEEGDPRLRAVRVGGRLTGLSAIQAMGGWCFPSPQLHVSVYRNAARLRTQLDRFLHPPAGKIPGVRLHWEHRTVRANGSATMVSLADALYRVCCDESLETAVAAIDWAMNAGLLDRFDLTKLILALPEDRRGIESWVDDQCGSFPESLSRTRFRLAGHRVVSQVPVADIQAIDLVVDGIVAYEVDGKEFHLNRFDYDRRKDLAMTMEGLHAVRATARMVFSEWDLLLRGVRAAIAQHPQYPAPQHPPSPHPAPPHPTGQLAGTALGSPGQPARPRSSGNSGVSLAGQTSFRGISGWTHSRRRRTPEFPKYSGPRRE
jgi:very-short-patch-repair endonuclease